MPIITVEMFEGRSIEQKREIAKTLTEVFCQTAGGNPEAVNILFKDVAKYDFAIGGQLCSEKYPD